MSTVFNLDEQEIREVFRIFRNIADDAHYRHHPKKEWPLYDKLADYLGEPTLEQHNICYQPEHSPAVGLFRDLWPRDTVFLRI